MKRALGCRLLLVVALTVLSLIVPAAAAATVWISNDNQYGTSFTNDDAEFTIWKGCYPNPGATIGPAYVGRVIRNGQVLLNDEAGDQGGLNSGRGGLGTFGFHYTRGNPNFAVESHPFTTDITGRTCSNGNSQGVYRVDIRQGPYVSGNVGVLDMTVWLRDNWGNTGYGPDSDGNGVGDAGVKLDYDTRVYDSVVKQWVAVTTYFQSNWEGPAFWKEPKFTGGVPNSNAGYRRTAIFGNADGQQLIKTLTGNFPTGCANCHTYADNRLRVRYDYGTDTTANSACADAWPCLNVVFRSTPPGGGWNFWEGTGGGLDQLAVNSHSRAYVNPTDQPNSNPNNGLPYSWNCNSNTYSPPSPLDQGVRGWEHLGWSGGAYQPYSTVTTLATGWEGGRGAYDCEPLYRQFGSPGDSYTVELNYSINAGW